MFYHLSPTCKVTAGLQTPHQYLLDGDQTTDDHFFWTHGIPLVDICMFHLKLAHLLHIYPSRFRIEIVQRCCQERKHFWYCRNVQCPVPGCSVLRNARIMSTISMYCNLKAVVLLEYLRVLFLSISFIRSTASARQASPAINYPSITRAKQLYPDQGFQFYFLLEYLHLYINDFQWTCIVRLTRLLREIQIFRLYRLLLLYVAMREPHQVHQT